MTVEGVVLAAGLSSRFEGYKLSKKILGKSMIEHTVFTMLPYVSHIYVVLGHNREIIEGLLSAYDDVTCVYNEDYLQGMFTSFKAACKHITGDRCFFIPGDQPLVEGKTYKKLLSASGEVIVPSINKRAGHPILLDRSLIDQLKNSESLHMRDFLSKYKKTYLQVEDAGILKDIDTIEDYNKYIGGSNEDI